MTDRPDDHSAERVAPSLPRTPMRRRGMSSVSTWQGATIAIVVYCLLASTSLVRAAQGQDDGIAGHVAYRSREAASMPWPTRCISTGRT